MKLMFVRHAEPDYKHDSLTLKGHREAQLLSLRLAKLDVRDFYASPLGRAQETARYTLERTHRTAETLPWRRADSVGLQAAAVAGASAAVRRESLDGG